MRLLWDWGGRITGGDEIGDEGRELGWSGR